MNRRSLLPLLVALVAMVCLGQASARADLVTGLKAYYNFNQSSGSTLPLSYGTGNDGVLNNMDNSDWVPGQANYGNALDFDGVNDYVLIPDGYTNTVSGDDTHTFSAWLYPRSLANNPVFLDSQDGGYYDYFMELSPSIKAYTAVGTTFRTYSGSPLSLNAWHQFVFTKTGAGNSGDLYIDGALVASYSGSIGNTVTQTSDFLLARFKNANFEFNGLIDDVAFWDRNLSEAEILQLYTAGIELDSLANPPLPAPEPSSLLLIGLGGLALIRRTRGRK